MVRKSWYLAALAVLAAACAAREDDPSDDTGPDVDLDEVSCEEADRFVVYADADGDGFGDPDVSGRVCEAGPGEVTNADDCDDTDAALHPGAVEHCDDVDEDCDGRIDEDAVDRSDWYRDDDGDGYGREGGILACEAPPLFGATMGGDCDDEDADTYPGAPEAVCSSEDRDCDGLMPPRVQIDSGAGFSTIQAAVDAAAVGDTVLVCPGTYPEAVTVTRDLSIEGQTHVAADVRIEPSPGSFTSSAARLHLQGLTFSGGGAGTGTGNALIGGVRTHIEDCIFEDGTSDYEGGGLNWGGTDRTGRTTLRIERTTFESNYADYGGGGLTTASWGPYAVRLEDVVFRDNTAGYQGGGASLATLDREAPDRVDMELVRVTFERNDADYEGGGLAIGGWRQQTVLLEDCEFTDNTAGYEGGGASIDGWSPTDLTVRGSRFEANDGAGRGDALQVGSWSDDVVALEEIEVVDNICSSSTGRCRAIDLGGWGGTEVSLTESTIARNSGGMTIGGRGMSYTAIVEATAFRDNGNVALSVEGDVEVIGGSFWTNLRGLTVSGDLFLDKVDLGSGASDNVEYDLSTSGASSFYPGVTSLSCVSGTCTP